MSKKGRNRNQRVRIGEIIEIKSEFGIFPSGIYRVDGVQGDLILLSAGEIRVGVSKDFVKITARHLPVPASWNEREIEILESSACECEECRALLIQKRGSVQVAHSEASVVQ